MILCSLFVTGSSGATWPWRWWKDSNSQDTQAKKNEPRQHVRNIFFSFQFLFFAYYFSIMRENFAFIFFFSCFDHFTNLLSSMTTSRNLREMDISDQASCSKQDNQTVNNVLPRFSSLTSFMLLFIFPLKPSFSIPPTYFCYSLKFQI